MAQEAEDEILKLHVDEYGVVWRLAGDRMPESCKVTVKEFLDAAPASKARLLGTQANAPLLVGLADQGVSLEVAGAPAIYSGWGQPFQELLSMRSIADCPSRGGWHTLTPKESMSYRLALAEDDDTRLELLKKHVVWPFVSIIDHLSLSRVAELVGEIMDPRFYVSPREPNRLSRLWAYLGLDPGRRGANARRRAALVLQCWKHTVCDHDHPSHFLWKCRDSWPTRGDLRTSQHFVAYLRHTWLGAIYREEGRNGEDLFIPEHFFEPETAAWFREVTSGKRVRRREYGRCPKCQHECDEDDGKHVIETKDHRKTSTGYGPGEDWIEVWKCPRCAHLFEERNGYP